jgi:predicted nuclease of predicted toxin-antitoxin system
MKLLFDHHLSRKLVARVADLFPESSHVVLHGLDQASDLDSLDVRACQWVHDCDQR